MAFASGIRGVEIGLGERARAVADGLRDKWSRYKVYRDMLDELRSLSERDLADLGIHRSQINAIAIEAAYGA